jgi:hypothetical protein
MFKIASIEKNFFGNKLPEFFPAKGEAEAAGRKPVIPESRSPRTPGAAGSPAVAQTWTCNKGFRAPSYLQLPVPRFAAWRRKWFCASVLNPKGREGPSVGFR